jgi:hypothetical protein
MSRDRPAADCRQLTWADARPLSDPAQVAVEDYARALLRAAAAEILLDEGGRVCGVHVCGLAAEPSPEARRDLEAFVLDIAQREDGGGLGWS